MCSNHVRAPRLWGELLVEPSSIPLLRVCVCLHCRQVRPNEHVRFKQISLAEAFTAIYRTDAMVEALTALARGTLTLEQAQQQLDNFKVHALPGGSWWAAWSFSRAVQTGTVTCMLHNM